VSCIEPSRETVMKRRTKRLLMLVALAAAFNFSAFDVLPASANDAHHPAAPTAKAKKDNSPAAKSKAKSRKRSSMLVIDLLDDGRGA
jgi:hypothetical protein